MIWNQSLVQKQAKKYKPSPLSCTIPTCGVSSVKPSSMSTNPSPWWSPDAVTMTGSSFPPSYSSSSSDITHNMSPFTNYFSFTYLQLKLGIIYMVPTYLLTINFRTFQGLSRTIKTLINDLLEAHKRLNTNSIDLLKIQSVIQCTKFIISNNLKEIVQLHLFTHGAVLVLQIVYFETQ